MKYLYTGMTGMSKWIKCILNISIYFGLFLNYGYAGEIIHGDEQCDPDEIIFRYNFDTSTVWIFQREYTVNEGNENQFDTYIYNNQEDKNEKKINFGACSYNYCSNVSVIKYKQGKDINYSFNTILYVNYFHPAIGGDSRSYQPDGEAVFAIQDNKVCYIYKNGRTDFNSAIDDTKRIIRYVLNDYDKLNIH